LATAALEWVVKTATASSKAPFVASSAARRRMPNEYRSVGRFSAASSGKQRLQGALALARVRPLDAVRPDHRARRRGLRAEIEMRLQELSH
jgi:hypothetical protein